jgi:branched-chain amino acid transport system permease protein
MAFFLETLIGGLMAGMLYALVALGFVLIFKASGVFNFAQGAMVLFAALAMARFAEWMPWLASTAIVANLLPSSSRRVMFASGLADRAPGAAPPGQPGRRTLLMATLGITYFLEGLGQTLFGSDIYKIDVGMPKDPCSCWTVFDGGVLINKEDVIAAAIAACWWLPWPVLPEDQDRPRAARRGRRPPGRAVHRHSAPHLGHRLVRGRRRGAGGRDDLGQQAGRAVLADHRGARLPVVILGGLTSVPGAIIGGLIIGVGEKLSEVTSALVGGGIEIWFAYVLALVFLLFRPQGCSAKDHRPRLNHPKNNKRHVLSRKRPVQDQLPGRPADLPIRQDRCHPPAAGGGLPGGADAGQRLLLPRHPDPLVIMSLAALGVNILVGYCGQISLGSAPSWPWVPTAPTTSRAHSRHAADSGADPGRPVRHLLRHPVRPAQPAHQGPVPGRGHAGGAVLRDWMFLRIKWFTNDSPSGSVSVSNLQVFGMPIESATSKYLFCLALLVVIALLAKNLVRGAIGREWMAIRDMDVAASVIGIRPMYAKLSAFAVSSFIVGVAGALWAFVHLGAWEPPPSRWTCPSSCCS